MRILSANLYMLRILWRACPSRVLVQILSRCLSLSYGAFYTLVFFRYLLDARAQSRGFGEVLLFLLGFTLFGLANAALKAWYTGVLKPRSDQVIARALTERIYAQSLRVELSCYEDPAYYDSFTRASEHAAARADQSLELLANVISVLWAMLLNAGFAVWMEPGLLLLSIVPTALSFVFERAHGKARYAQDMDGLRARRKAEYVKRVVYLADYVKELRLTRVFEPLRRMFGGALGELVRVSRKHGPRIALYRFLAEHSTLVLLYLLLNGYIAYRFIATGTMTLGEFAALSGAVINFSHFMQELAERYNELYEHGLYAGNLRTFLSREPALVSGDVAPTFERELALNGVRFGYDGGAAPVLGGVTLRIRKGEMVAIVGHNGAGKTTLAKLLLRLYDAGGGALTLDGTDIRALDLPRYRALFATAFQDFQIFPASVAENVLMRAVCGEADEEAVRRALTLSGAWERVCALPDGMHAQLTREFDEGGALLSGGELQKLALARVFASGAPIALLDEPSSALDPVAEHEMFERLRAASSGRTVVMISHRLSSTRMADTIYMMENGAVLECGSHAQLMARGGAYARMYEMQAERYRQGGDAL